MIAAIGLALAAALVFGISVLLFGFFETLGSPRSEQQAIRPMPGLVESQQSLTATEVARLASYGSTDGGGGNFHIPIERAMEIIAEDGAGVESSGPADGPAVPPGSDQLAASPPEIYIQLGCPACHFAEATVNAPTLVGLYGKEVQLENGQTVRADEEYLRDSILHPSVQLVSGYQPIMPGYEGQVDEDELQTLIAYIRSLAGQ
jgi:hypothetical protein